MPSEIEYRLAWEMPNALEVNDLEVAYGKDCWSKIPWEKLEIQTWRLTEVLFKGDERMSQYRQLKSWAESKEQPIRNVTLEQHEVNSTEWVKVDAPDPAS